MKTFFPGLKILIIEIRKCQDGFDIDNTYHSKNEFIIKMVLRGRLKVRNRTRWSLSVCIYLCMHCYHYIEI